jgi:hypothetical protein
MDGESIDIKQDKLQKLKELFPALFASNDQLKTNTVLQNGGGF